MSTKAELERCIESLQRTNNDLRDVVKELETKAEDSLDLDGFKVHVNKNSEMWITIDEESIEVDFEEAHKVIQFFNTWLVDECEA